MVAGVELRRDGIFSSRLAATALYTTSPSVAYLRIDLRIHHNGKSTGTWAGYYRMSFDFEPRLTLPNALTCCVLRFVELTARRSIWHLSGLI